MAKIIVENTREHDITISVKPSANDLVQITVPGARQDPADKTKLVNGRAEAEDVAIEAAKDNPVVAHYFEEGWLRIVKPAVKPAAKQGDKQGDKKE